MSKRKTIIELQIKPENKALRKIVEKTKPVEFASINPPILKARSDDSTLKTVTNGENNDPEIKSSGISKTSIARKLESASQNKENTRADKSAIANELDKKLSNDKSAMKKKQTENVEPASAPPNLRASAQIKQLRIFQTSTPVTRTLTKFQKAAIVVRGANGKQLIELLWRDQMNEKTRDIWDFLRKKFTQDEKLITNEVSIRKRDILQGSGVKSDRTFISAIYTLEDMGLIEVRRLSGNKEGNIYILTEEGREEIDADQQNLIS